jgi:uncharacterized integral membrane protein
MRKLVATLILVPIGVLLVALAVVNRKQVVLGLNPFDANAGFGIEAPLFLFLLGAFALGLVIGGFATWLGQGKWRKTARVEAREASTWQRQADRLEKELEGLDARPRRARLAAVRASTAWGRFVALR